MARLAPAAGESCYPITTNCRCNQVDATPSANSGWFKDR